MQKLIPKRKIADAKQNRSINNYVEYVTQTTETTQQGWNFPYRLKIPVGANKYG